MILVDTSAWIEFLRNTGTAAHRRLRDAIATDEPLATTGLVVLEVLAGARDERQADVLERSLSQCRLLRTDEPLDHVAAASIYRTCRRHGVTIRRLPDCLIAAVAIRNSVPVLHRDADFDAIARHAPLAVAEAG